MNKPFCAKKAYRGNISWPWKNASSLHWPLRTWHLIQWYCRFKVKNSEYRWGHWKCLPVSCPALSSTSDSRSSQPTKEVETVLLYPKCIPGQTSKEIFYQLPWQHTSSLLLPGGRKEKERMMSFLSTISSNHQVPILINYWLYCESVDLYFLICF